MLPTRLTATVRFVAAITAVWLAMETRDCAAQGLEQMMIGNWELDIAATKKLGGKSAVEYAFLGDFDVSLRFDFRAEGVLAMTVHSSGDDSNDSGKWSVTKEDPLTKKLTIDVQTGEAKDLKTIVVEFVEANRIKATEAGKEDESNAPFILRRVAPKQKK